MSGDAAYDSNDALEVEGGAYTIRSGCRGVHSTQSLKNNSEQTHNTHSTFRRSSGPGRQSQSPVGVLSSEPGRCIA